ncbi:unnamed protein product, partial [Schistosoma turkestanicum]
TPPRHRKSKVSSNVRDTSKESTQGASGAKKREKSVRGRNAKEIDTGKDDKSGAKGKKTDNNNSNTNTTTNNNSPKKATNQEQRSSGKNKTGRNIRSAKQTSDTERLESSPDMNELMNPLLDKAIYVEPDGLLIVGNFVLAFLNLSRNSIGMNGLKALLEAITYQVNLLNVENATTNIGTGILTLLLDNNTFNPECEIMTSISDLLASRDPTARSINSNKMVDSELTN